MRISVMLVALVFLCPEVASSASNFTQDEAKVIAMVDDCLQIYTVETDAGKATITSTLIRVYGENRTGFLGVVALHGLIATKQVDAVAKVHADDAIVGFASKMASNVDEAVLDAERCENPGLRQFFEAWLVFEGLQSHMKENDWRSNRLGMTSRLLQN